MIDRSKPLYEQPANEVRALLDALHGNRERYDRANRIVEARSCELEIAEATRALAIINRRATEAEDQRVAEERAAIRKVVLEVCEDKLYRVGFHSGGSFGVEYDSDDKTKLLGEIADAIAISIGMPPKAQREADLREAFLDGMAWAYGRSRISIDQSRDAAAAEYARSKAGG